MRTFLWLPAAPAGVDETPDSFRNTSEKGSGFHVNSRQFSYPNSKLTRFPVPEEKVPWEVLIIYLNIIKYYFFSTTKSPVATPQKVTELINCPIILVVFISFFSQVSFSSYKPTNYTSDDSEDHVDGCVKPYFPVFTSILFEDSVESVFHMSRKQHSSSKL